MIPAMGLEGLTGEVSLDLVKLPLELKVTSDPLGCKGRTFTEERRLRPLAEGVAGFNEAFGDASNWRLTMGLMLVVGECNGEPINLLFELWPEWSSSGLLMLSSEPFAESESIVDGGAKRALSDAGLTWTIDPAAELMEPKELDDTKRAWTAGCVAGIGLVPTPASAEEDLTGASGSGRRELARRALSVGGLGTLAFSPNLNVAFLTSSFTDSEKPWFFALRGFMKRSSKLCTRLKYRRERMHLRHSWYVVLFFLTLPIGVRTSSSSHT
mmetsp:Transcript_48809/g.121923  ORF Transcript_48809/g.121923 Transcript_48809/m.121923 type:complete len:269 (-) Transcript_48809:897-1703(-)